MSQSHLLSHLFKLYGHVHQQAQEKRLLRELIQDPCVLHHLKQLDSAIVQAYKKLGLPLQRTPNMLKRPPANAQKPRKPEPIRMRIANVMAGQLFQEEITLQDAVDGKIEITHVHPDESFEEATCQNDPLIISAKATQAGDYKIKVSCFQYLPNGEKRAMVGELKVTVIPDPKTLWKNLPSDDTARFHKPDADSQRLLNDKAILLGGSVRGRSHAHTGIHRDDDFSMEIANKIGEWNILCVADGAGSCPYSRRGSEIASRSTAETLKEALNGYLGEQLIVYYKALAAENNPENQQRLQQVYQQTMVKAVYTAALKIQEEVDKNPGDSFKDYSTTLLVAAHKPLEDGHIVFGFWVGDGGAVIYQENEQVTLFGKPDGGQFAGQTRFLDKKMFEDGSVYSRVFLTKVPAMTAIILATDGITDPWFDSERQMGEIEKWDALWQEVSPLLTEPDEQKAKGDLIEWLNFWSPGHHDDRSIAICSIKS